MYESFYCFTFLRFNTTVNRISEGGHLCFVSDLGREKTIIMHDHLANKYNILGRMEMHTRIIMYDCSYVLLGSI